MQITDKNKVSDWIEELQRRGRITFSLKEACEQFPLRNISALRNTLARLTAKGKICSVWQGLYAINPVEYSSVGMIPAVLYLTSQISHL